MPFVFSRLFFILLAIGFVPLSLSWNLPILRYFVLIYDILLVALAFFDYFSSRNLSVKLTITRKFSKRFAIGDQTEVRLIIENHSPNSFKLQIKDEFPPEMKLSEPREAKFTVEAQTVTEFFYNLTPPRRGKYEFGKTAVRYLSKFRLVWCQTNLGEAQTVKVYPNMRRAREMELAALGAHSMTAVQRKAILRGEGTRF